MLNIAKTPPMGWNSWDCYGASVTEEELLGNAEYIKEKMKPFGWEYVICDIQWYEPAADSSRYHKFAPVTMDTYSRLLPAPNRFPSAADGHGFRTIARTVHQMGLKFGIHMMRGIPRQAVYENRKILGSDATARDIAHPYSICSWNTDMYGVDETQPGAQEYYDSLFQLYAEWEIDYVKVDDICVTEFKPSDLYSAKAEIEMVRKAIDRCNRDMVLSLSPGPALIEEAAHLKAHANMWRLTGDFWDRWSDLYGMFERCSQWAPYVGEHHWPDCDMLPLGHIGIRAREHDFPDRMTYFTREEQRSMMTLWCIFRSPLMMGGELRDNDEFTVSLLTNEPLLRVHREGRGARQVSRIDETVMWAAKLENGGACVAVFNLNDREMEIELDLWVLPELSRLKRENAIKCLDVWSHVCCDGLPVKVRVAAHGTACYLIEQNQEVSYADE